MKKAKWTSCVVVVAACWLCGSSTFAGTIQTIGAGSAVSQIDRSVPFDPLNYATNGTPLSDYVENGMFIGTDGDSWVGDGVTDFDPYHGANGSDRTFYFPYGGSIGWVTIYAADGHTMYALEFMYGNGWTTGNPQLPWGNDGAIVEWKTWKAGALVTSGVIGDAPILEMGTIVGFYDLAGFDQLDIRCTISSSGNPELQALALDNLIVQETSIARPGDMNCDGVVTFDDINPFVLALSDPAGYAAAFPNCNIMNGDCDHNGLINFDDINPFVAILSGGG